MTAMGGLVLIIIGAILKWAVDYRPQSVDLDVVGTILMCGGAGGIVLGLILTFAHRRENRMRDGYDDGYHDDRYGPPPPGY
jgi:uncharacterized YccA/Bax inhibitor family protein